MLCRSLAGKGKHHRRCIPKRLLHMVHHIGNRIKVFLWRDTAPSVLTSKNTGRLCRKMGLVKALLVIAAGIRHLNVRHGKHIGGIYAAGKKGFRLFFFGLHLRQNLLESGVNLICPVLKRLTLIRMKLWFPVTLNLQFPILPN